MTKIKTMIQYQEKIIKWCDIAIETGFIIFILVAPIKEHTATIKSIGIALPLLAWLIKIAVNKKFNWIRTPLDLPFALFILFSVLSIFVSVNTGETIRALKNFLLKFIIIYFTLVNNIKDDHQRKRLLSAIVIINIFIGSMASFNYLSGARLPGSVGAFAFSLNHNGLARFLVITIPVIGIFYSLSKSKISSLPFIALFFISTLGIVLSYSRSGWIAFSASLLLWIVFKDRKAIAIFLVVGILSAIFVGPGSLKLRVKEGLKRSSLQNRPAYWKAAVAMIKEKPVLGFGYSHRIYKDIYPDYKPQHTLDELPSHVHSTYLAVGVESGMLGMLTLLWIFFVYFKETLQGIFQSKDEQQCTILIGVLASFVSFLIFGLAEPMLIDQEGMCFWILAGIAMGIIARGTHK